MTTIRDSYESERGCGFRKARGIYLVADGPNAACPKLPIPVGACPTCGHGIKPARGWAWIDADPIVQPEPHGEGTHRLACPLSRSIGKAGLLWIGGSFYPTPESWTAEAHGQGVSRRIAQVPKGLVVGETLVLVAHREVRIGAEKVPAIFHAFRPTALEYVVAGDESAEELARLEKRGLSLVRVHPITDELPLRETS